MSAFIQVNFDINDNLSKDQVLDLLGMQSVDGPAVYGGLELDVRYVEVPENWIWDEHFLEIGNGGDLGDDVMTQEFIVDQSNNLFEAMEATRGKKLISRIPSFERQLVESKEQLASLNSLKSMYPNSLPDLSDFEEDLNQGLTVKKSHPKKKMFDTLMSALDTKTVMGRILSTLEENKHPFLQSLRDQALSGKRLSAKQISALGKFSRTGTVDKALLKRVNAILKKKPNNKFLKSIQSQISSGRKLSQKQLDAISNFEGGKKKPATMTIAQFQRLGHDDKIKVVLGHFTASQIRSEFDSESAKMVKELKKSGWRGTDAKGATLYTDDELSDIKLISDYLVKGGGHAGNEFLESLTFRERKTWVEGTLLTY